MSLGGAKPIYQEIAERICDEIMLGVYREGDRVPSVRDYAAQMEVNANTAMRSYATLEGEGILESRRGLGYFVGEGAEESILKARRRSFSETIAPGFFRRMDALGYTTADVSRMYAEYQKARKEEENEK